jgi:hypothetical protein
VIFRQIRQFFSEVHFMAVTVQQVLDKVSAINTEVQAIRDFITANPSATPAQLQQISDGLDVDKSNLDNLKTQLGVTP